MFFYVIGSSIPSKCMIIVLCSLPLLRGTLTKVSVPCDLNMCWCIWNTFLSLANLLRWHAISLLYVMRTKSKQANFRCFTLFNTMYIYKDDKNQYRCKCIGLFCNWFHSCHASITHFAYRFEIFSFNLNRLFEMISCSILSSFIIRLRERYDSNWIFSSFFCVICVCVYFRTGSRASN